MSSQPGCYALKDGDPLAQHPLLEGRDAMRRRAVKHITQQADDAAGQLAMPRCRLLLGRRRVVRWRWRCLRVCAHTQALRRCYQAERCCRQCGAGIQEATSSLPQHKRLHLLPREAKLGHRQLWCLLLRWSNVIWEQDRSCQPACGNIQQTNLT